MSDQEKPLDDATLARLTAEIEKMQAAGQSDEDIRSFVQEVKRQAPVAKAPPSSESFLSRAWEGAKDAASSGLHLAGAFVGVPGERERMLQGLATTAAEVPAHPLKAAVRLVGGNPENIYKDYQDKNYPALAGDAVVPAAMLLGPKAIPKIAGPLGEVAGAAARPAARIGGRVLETVGTSPAVGGSLAAYSAYHGDIGGVLAGGTIIAAKPLIADAGAALKRWGGSVEPPVKQSAPIPALRMSGAMAPGGTVGPEAPAGAVRVGIPPLRKGPMWQDEGSNTVPAATPTAPSAEPTVREQTAQAFQQKFGFPMPEGMGPRVPGEPQAPIAPVASHAVADTAPKPPGTGMTVLSKSKDIKAVLSVRDFPVLTDAIRSGMTDDEAIAHTNAMKDARHADKHGGAVADKQYREETGGDVLSTHLHDLTEMAKRQAEIQKITDEVARKKALEDLMKQSSGGGD